MEQTDSDQSGDEVFRDGSAENCPDCGGDLQYQNRVAVLCLDCGTDFEHFHTTTEHQLFTVTDDEAELEIVATEPIETREVATDGGTDAVARVYHDGEHIADLHTMRLYHEFNEYPAYEVELLEERTEAIV